MRRTTFNHQLVKSTLDPVARTASVAGAGVDLLQGRQKFRTATVVVQTGAITDGTHDIEVQESDDDVTYTAVAAADLQGTEPSIGVADDNTVFEVGYVGSKRHLRASVTVTGATSGGIYGAVVVLGQPSRPPVTH